jgi:hypothetical protein
MRQAAPQQRQPARELGTRRVRKLPVPTVGETRDRIQRKRYDQIRNLNYEVPTVTTLRGNAGKDEHGKKRPPVRAQTNVKWAPGMEDIARTLVAMEKDIKVIRGATCVRGAEEWARKRGGPDKGWNVHHEDIVGCEEPEVFVTNPKGEIVMVNGMKLAPSKHAERQLYSMVNTGRNKEERKYTTRRHLRDRAHATVQTEDGFAFDDEMFPEQLLPYAKRVRKKLRARDVFRQYVFDPLYNRFEMQAELQNNRAYIGLVKARMIRNASTTLYRLVVETELVAEYRTHKEEEPFEIDIMDTNNPEIKAIVTRVRRSSRYEERARDWVSAIIKRLDTDPQYKTEIEERAFRIIDEQANLELGDEDQQAPRIRRRNETRARLERGMADRRRRLRPNIVWLPGEDPIEDQTRDDTGPMRSVVEQRRREPPPEDEYDDEPPHPINPQLQNITDEEFLQERRRLSQEEENPYPPLQPGFAYRTNLDGEIIHNAETGEPIIVAVDEDGNELDQY